MSEAKHRRSPAPYASSDDFCRIFNQEMDGFYLLSFLLTADREKAEQCFVSGLEDSMKGNPVFKEWACSWARRAVIRNAVRVINPRPMEGQDRSNSASLNGAAKTPAEEREEIAAVLKLGPFERFVYVLSILERYSDQDCSVLLGCARRDVLSARTRALQQIRRAVKLNGQQLSNVDSGNPASRDRRTSVLESLVALRLAPSA